MPFLKVPDQKPIILEKRNEDFFTSEFKERKEEMEEVSKIIREKGWIPSDLVDNEVKWFFNNLGIDDMYFTIETSETIAKHILALYGAKLSAFTNNDNSLKINLEQEMEDKAVFIHTSEYGVDTTHEQRIDNKYLDTTNKNLFRIECYRSLGSVSTNFPSQQLRCYFVQKCNFVVENPSKNEMMDINKVSDKVFLNRATDNILNIYSNIMSEVMKRTGPVLQLHSFYNSQEKRVIIGYRQHTTQQFFSALHYLYRYYGLYSPRKYVEQFSNGISIICMYLKQIPGKRSIPFDHAINQVMKEASLIFCIPVSPFQVLFRESKLNIQEVTYAHVGWIFASHFLNRLGNEYSSLVNILDQNNVTHMEVLNKIKNRLRQDTFTREYIEDTIMNYPELTKLLYTNFAMVHYINSQTENDSKPTISYQRIQEQPFMEEDELRNHISKVVDNHHEFMVFDLLLTFNKHILKTNFFQPTKVSISFRLDPSYLPSSEYSTKPFGMFFIVGSEFHGFHIRFKDIARGGIRIVKSRNRDAYAINFKGLFDENYGLAATQQRKNKDIPEGGSKGTILMDYDKVEKSKVAFHKYVDAIIDLLVTGNSPGIKEKIVDLYKKEEILFFGPDEGTAEYMDWASQHAKKRGLKIWKGFATGKSQSLGGIPHDKYGMTTRGIHTYVTCLFKKLNLKEEKCYKFQTGGPDGDLGSNEILISKDHTIAIVDGSGVLYDPDGINRKELTRLARERKMINFADTKTLGPRGFRVLIDEKDITLPDGSIVENGLTFRNEFHLNPLAKSDIFVPCGGRPESINISNVHRLIGEDGVPIYKYIVEGANLFITQEARLYLEKAGVILYKDASANKGGVTSSSLEVLASLSFNDAEFEENMQVKGGIVPEFYNEYIKCVHEIIEKNAQMEFEAIWSEAEKSGKPKCVISDKLSIAINKLNDELQESSFWIDKDLREVVLIEAIPNLLLEKVGIKKIIERVPENYLKAIFGCHMASLFVYKYGISSSQFAFVEFMEPYTNKKIHYQNKKRKLN